MKPVILFLIFMFCSAKAEAAILKTGHLWEDKAFALMNPATCTDLGKTVPAAKRDSLESLFRIKEVEFFSADFFGTYSGGQNDTIFENTDDFDLRSGVKNTHFSEKTFPEDSGVIAYGNLSISDYDKFLSGEQGPFSKRELSYLLFNLDPAEMADYGKIRLRLIADESGSESDRDLIGALQKVPEPSSMLLFILGGATLSFLHKMKKVKNRNRKRPKTYKLR